MRQEIRPGDLVMVVRWPCCGWLLGVIDTVSQIANGIATSGTCAKCKARHGALAVAVTPKYYLPLVWLKRIDPLSEPESITNEVTA